MAGPDLSPRGPATTVHTVAARVRVIRRIFRCWLAALAISYQKYYGLPTLRSCSTLGLSRLSRSARFPQQPLLPLSLSTPLASHLSPPSAKPMAARRGGLLQPTTSATTRRARSRRLRRLAPKTSDKEPDTKRWWLNLVHVHHLVFTSFRGVFATIVFQFIIYFRFYLGKRERAQAVATADRVALLNFEIQTWPKVV